MKKILLWFLLFFPVLPCFSEELSQQSREIGILSGFYAENHVHPGFYVGAEKQLSQKGLNEWWIAAKAGYVQFVPMYKTLFLETEGSYRLQFPFGLNLSGILGFGYRHTFAGSSVYTVEGGQLVQVQNSGMPLFAFSASVGLGYDLNHLLSIPIGIQTRYGIWAEMPYNRKVLMHLSWSAGLVYQTRIGGRHE